MFHAKNLGMSWFGDTKSGITMIGPKVTAEALRAYERLRVLLREELGIAPSPDLQAVYRRLLGNADG